MTRIWIDADSCPKKVRTYTAKYAENHSLEIIFAANKPLIDLNGYAKMVICSKEKDAADDYIYYNASAGDIVITRDIILAERLVSKGISVINDRGTAFTKDNIKNRLADSALNLQLAQIGLGGASKSCYTNKNFDAFIKCFHKEIKNLNSLNVEFWK